MNKRKLSAFIIVLGSLGFFFWTFLNASGEKKDNPLFNISDSKNNNSNLNYESLANISGLSNLNSNTVSDGNLTEKLIQTYAQAIVNENSSEIQNLNGEKGIKTLSGDALQQLITDSENQKLTIPELQEKDIKISSDNSKDSQINYIKKLGEISTKNFKGFDKDISGILDETLSKNKTDSLEKYLTIVSKQIDDLRTLEAPSAWKTFHLQNLNLWQKKLTVYSAVLNHDDDPLKIILAIKEIPNVFEENNNLQKVLEEKIKEFNS